MEVIGDSENWLGKGRLWWFFYVGFDKKYQNKEKRSLKGLEKAGLC